MFIFDITTYHGGFAVDDENFRMHFQLDNGPEPEQRTNWLECLGVEYYKMMDPLLLRSLTPS